MEKNTARIVSIEDIEKSINISEDFKKCFVTPNGVMLEEVNIIGKAAGYIDNRKDYLRIKDETGECCVKMIWQNQTKNIDEETMLLVIGFLNFDGQRKYINPYIVKKIEENATQRCALRRLEIIEFCNYIHKNSGFFSENMKKYKKAHEKMLEKKQVDKKEPEKEDIEKSKGEKNNEVTKDRMIEIIKQLDAEDKGVSYVDILDKFSEEQREMAETVIDSLLDEGLCYEPLAGKIKVL
ncbi:MAG: hypothetical protein DRN66_02920 [Candidatus Nanohalarchaeota archaeon]|nr:MAG: hypothetical protein DRN66_02920 [Candidatus Nanohaloarchaeota archaeon]